MAAGPWWQQSGDALLDDMVAQALSAMPPVCLPPRRGLQAVLHRQSAAKRHAQQQERAAQRLHKAEAVAEAYLRFRLWQERLLARHAMLAPWVDNAEIAHFRREAGLVPALDEDMAGVMVGLNGADEDAARAALQRALEDLAGLTGQDAAALRARLEKTSAMPLGNQGSANQGGANQGSSPAVQQAQALLAKAEAARANARIAYRGGAASFATLYLAEANALAAREAQLLALHQAALALIRQWSAADGADYRGEEVACG